ncbi:MAG: methyltransferase domain-containing protein [Ignavibacteriae bacterium]|nr:MAG: methyltransferase domain-containing protein [Ignavibacteriota bacterium]
MAEKEYLLGANDTELQRLQFQHNVWKKITDGFFDRLSLEKGIRILDVGAGPGFVSLDLLERTGKESEITVLEPSELFINYIKDFSLKNNISNFRFINNTVENTELPANYYDFIFLRWVIAFVAEPELFLAKLVKSLAPRGVIAIQDYAYEGISLYPRGGAFDNIPDAVRKYYNSTGGDPYITTKIPGMFKENGIKLIDFNPHILAGNPSSRVYEWANKFFSTHIQHMADKGIVDQKTADEMLTDWIEHRESEDSIFFSPIVVDVAGKKVR